MKKTSIAFRITIWYVAFLVIIASVLMVTLLRFYDFRERSTAERTLVRIVDDTGDAIIDDGDEFITDSRIRYYTKDTYISVYSRDGELVTGRRPRGFDSFPEFNFEDTQVVQDVSGGEWYVYDTTIHMSDDHLLYIRGMMNNVTHVQGNFLLYFFAFAIPLLIVLAAVGGWLISGRALAPLRDLINVTDEIRLDADLSRRVPVPGSGDEVSRLAESFNGMFERIEEVVSREKQFTSDVSHELRTPLTVIRTQSEFAMEDAEYAPRAAEVINRESKRLSELISRLLTLSRSDSGRMQPELREIDLTAVLTELVDQFRGMTAERNVSIIMINNAAGSGAGDGGQGVMVLSDEDLLLRVILNLLDNAVKYGRRDGGTVWIILNIEDGEAVCVIADDGEGIAEEDRERIWKRFYQTDAARSRSDSAGLGLAIVESLTRTIGGSIRLLPDEEAVKLIGEDAGAAFELRLPLAENNGTNKQ